MLVDNNISFEILEKNATLTTINGTEILARFDDDKKEVEISSDGEILNTVDVGRIANNDKIMWQAVKSYPANILLGLGDNVSLWLKCPDDYSALVVFETDKYEKDVHHFFRDNLVLQQEYNPDRNSFDVSVFISKSGVEMSYDNLFDEDMQYNHTRHFDIDKLENVLGCTIDDEMFAKLSTIDVYNLVAMLPLFDEHHKAKFDVVNYFEHYDMNKKQNNVLCSGYSPIPFAHEMGHSLEMETSLHQDDELYQIYLKEYSEFVNKYPRLANRFEITHFSDQKIFRDGLKEIIAETNLLSTFYVPNDDDDDFDSKNRTHVLVENFPETVSYICSKLYQ